MPPSIWQAMRLALQRGLSAAASGALGADPFEAAPAQVLGLLHAVDFTARREPGRDACTMGRAPEPTCLRP